MNRSTLRHVALAVVIGISFTIFGCGDEEEMMAKLPFLKAISQVNVH